MEHKKLIQETPISTNKRSKILTAERQNNSMKHKNKYDDDYDDGKIGIDEYTDFMCGMAVVEVLATIIAILLVFLLP